MESFLYDGSFTAHCHLEDLRIGDIIEFAYTTEGANPVKKGKFSTTLPTDWYYPVRHAVTRVVYPAQRGINFRVENKAIKPTIVTANGIIEWVWEESNVPGRKPDPDVPPDYDPCGWVQVSEFTSWEQVADWGVALYQPNATPSADLRGQIDRLRAIPTPNNASPPRYVSCKTRFVTLGLSQEQVQINQVIPVRFCVGVSGTAKTRRGYSARS